MPTKSDKQYEEDEILWRQMIIAFYRLHLNSPPETSYNTEERFQGWYGNDGVPQEYQILIDSMESGYGLVTDMHQINEYRLELDLLDVGYTTVRRTMNRLDPVIRKIRRRKQGKRDPNSPWTKARLRWVTQLLVRLGKHKFDAEAQENKHLQLTNTPPYFDRLPRLSLHQIVFFDECH
jgi:hypothetical protein